VHFIFDLVHHSEILQTYLLGDSSHLKKYIQNDPYLSKMNIDMDDLINKNNILELIETNPNFLLSYQNLIILNKVQYKKKEIIGDIKRHFQQIKFKKESNQISEKLNYLQRIDVNFKRIKELIRNNVILINSFMNQSQPLTRGKSKIRQSKLFDTFKSIKTKSIISNFDSTETKNKFTNFSGKKEEDKSKLNKSRNLTIKPEELNFNEDKENNYFYQIDTNRPLISKESKELENINFENNLKERNSCSLSKKTESQILLPKHTEEKNYKKKRQSTASPQHQRRTYKKNP
jgi:hypothetical protein